MHTQEFLVSGRVQGVGYRWSTVQLAQRLHVTGTVKNLESGQVVIVASAATAILAKFERHLRHVCLWAHVVEVKVTNLPVQEFADFRIII